MKKKISGAILSVGLIMMVGTGCAQESELAKVKSSEKKTYTNDVLSMDVYAYDSPNVSPTVAASAIIIRNGRTFAVTAEGALIQKGITEQHIIDGKVEAVFSEGNGFTVEEFKLKGEN